MMIVRYSLAGYSLIAIISRCVKLHWLKIDESEPLATKESHDSERFVATVAFIDYGF